MGNVNKGFTLIELLVVISIIGLLSAIIMGGLNSGRLKSYDAKIKTNLVNVRNAVQLYQDSNPNNNFGPGPATNCTTNLFNDAIVRPLVDSNNYPPNAAPTCIAVGTPATSWAVQARLPGLSQQAGGDRYLCISNITVTPQVNVSNNIGPGDANCN